MAPTLVAGGLRYTGVDFSPGMLRIARTRHPGLDFAHGSISALPVLECSAEGILAWYSIIHTDTAGLPAVLEDFRRVLVPGGLLLLAFQAGSGQRTIRHAYGRQVLLTAHLYEPPQLHRMLLAAGFALEVTLVRAARSTERTEQVVILARAADASAH